MITAREAVTGYLNTLIDKVEERRTNQWTLNIELQLPPLTGNKIEYSERVQKMRILVAAADVDIERIKAQIVNLTSDDIWADEAATTD